VNSNQETEHKIATHGERVLNEQQSTKHSQETQDKTEDRQSLV